MPMQASQREIPVPIVVSTLTQQAEEHEPHIHCWVHAQCMPT